MDKVTVIILAGGDGTRARHHLPKQFYKLDSGKRIVELVLETYSSIDNIDNIIFSYNPKHEKLSKELCSKYSKDIHFVQAGATRHQSIYKALKEVRTKYVLVQDSARPLVNRNAVINCVKELQKGNYVVHTIFKSSATMFLIRNKHIKLVNRDEIVYPQCPIGFCTATILSYYKYAKQHSVEFQDDMSTAFYAEPKLDVKFVIGHQSGFKITYSEDLEILEAYIKGGDNEKEHKQEHGT